MKVAQLLESGGSTQHVVFSDRTCRPESRIQSLQISEYPRFSGLGLEELGFRVKTPPNPKKTVSPEHLSPETSPLPHPKLVVQPIVACYDLIWPWITRSAFTYRCIPKLCLWPLHLKMPKVVASSGSLIDYLSVELGHYPDDRFENRVSLDQESGGSRFRGFRGVRFKV